MAINPKNIFKPVALAFCAGLLAAGALVWARTLIPAYQARRAQKERNASFISRAKEAGLTYESVLADPAKAVGKPALWCLRSVQPRLAYYDNDESRKVYIDNPYLMGQTPGSSHQGCAETLVTISAVKALDLYTVRAVRVEVSFIAYP